MRPDVTRCSGVLAAVVCLALAGCSDSSGSGGFTAGAEVDLTVSPLLIDFPAFAAGSEAERVVVVQHVGSGGLLRLRDITLDSDSPDLVLVGPESVDLEAGEAQEFIVRYTPGLSAADHAVLSMTHNLPERAPIEIPISTPGQLGELVVDLPAVDFGVLRPGETSTIEVTYRNVGSAPIDLFKVEMDSNGSTDFSLQLPVGTFGELAIGASRSVSITYTPHGWDADQSTLVLRSTGAHDTITLPVSGVEMGPVIGAQPQLVAFGPVPEGETVVKSLMLRNVGSLDLVIDDISLAATSDSALSLLGAADGPYPITLGPNDKAWVDVSYTPETTWEQPGDLGTIVVESNDLSHQPYYVTVTGQPGAPVIFVSPGESIDFGFVGQTASSKRDVTITNQGQLPLNVASVRIIDHETQELRVTPDATFAPTLGSPTSAQIAPGATETVDLSFTNMGGPMGNSFGTLVVESDDPERPQWRVDLVAHRAGEPSCEPTFSPIVTMFGGVAHQTSKQVDVKLVNNGSGDCQLDLTWLDRCDQNGAIQVCYDGQTSPHFHQLAFPAGTMIGPGSAVAIPIRFDAPTFSGDETGVDRYQARISALVTDPQSGEQRQVPTATGGWEPGPNLIGDSGIPRINVYPDKVDFGFVPLGCRSQTSLVSLYSAGPIDVEVSNMAWGSCPSQWGLDNPPGVPLSIEAAVPIGLAPYHFAELLGEQSCELFVHSNDPSDPVHTVQLRSEGVPDEFVTETFEGKSVSLVDVLFVVDDSGSMGEEQDNLAANFSVFIEAANAWQSDYRIGVTTTDLDGIAGKLQGVPEIVTPDTWGAFIDNVLVGTNGSGWEQGIAAAEVSIAGSFGAYIRPDAALVIIFVSDEEDQSDGNETAYFNSFLNAKGGDSELFKAFAIVGPPGGCSSDTGSAEAGLRYISVADQSGGAYASICDGSFADALQEFGEGTFGPKKTFGLGGFPKPETVTVMVNGVECHEGWYLVGGKSIKFFEEADCMPDEGDVVEVTYELICY